MAINHKPVEKVTLPNKKMTIIQQLLTHNEEELRYVMA